MDDEERIRLDAYFDAQSEAVKIDFRRRYDLAVAVVRSARGIWAQIDDNEQAQRTATESKWRIAEYCLMFFGALLAWWLTPSGAKWDFNLGTFVMLVGFLLYCGNGLNGWMRERELRFLKQQQGDYLYRWESTGASRDLFWRHRGLAREEVKSGQLPDDKVVEAEKKLEFESAALLVELRRDLFFRASGTRENYLLSGKYELYETTW